MWWKKHRFLTFLGAFSLICLLLFGLFRLSSDFAEAFSVTVGTAVRLGLAYLSAPLPFSLFELLCGAFFLYVLFLLLFLPYCALRTKKPDYLSRCLLVVPCTLLIVFDLFCLGFAPCYHRHSTAEHMKLETEAVDREAVFFALEALVDTINSVAPRLTLNEQGESLAPAPLKEIRERVNEAANRFGSTHAFYQSEGVSAKSFLVSPLMTYTHISGVYGFFTGEANVNTNYPHFVVTATLAHETCHARGIAAENECNFLGAVLLMESGDPYLIYCGAASLLDDLYSVCRKLDAERCSEIIARLDGVYARDQRAYSIFFEPYRHSVAANVADKTNSAYLQSMGQSEGTVSYSRVIRLTAAWFAQSGSAA